VVDHHVADDENAAAGESLDVVSCGGQNVSLGLLPVLLLAKVAGRARLPPDPPGGKRDKFHPEVEGRHLKRVRASSLTIPLTTIDRVVPDEASGFNR
jgi:hypothetical protein